MASRLGHATSGLDVTAQSYSGDIRIHLYAKGEIDYVAIWAGVHGAWAPGLTLYDGPVADLLSPAARMRFFKDALKENF